ncbi:MAG: aromatic-ring-hydroxylating dioxygenase subunit beta, partial [Rhodococcus sp. (in: high G+C Gram-positive bacteria)]|uniref:aromatic-ring-hydroxylating dioxygenase subunit beta n=1 Tax=Rhodococcus sp. TaxID=1831 RepID=UPI003BB0DB55
MTANVTHEPASGVAGGASPGVGYPKPEGKRIPVGDPRHFQMVEFLEEESALLDDDDLTGWLGMLAPDVIYRAPVRVTREHRSRGMFESEMFHFNENAMTLMLKIMRFTQTDSAWSENPASRTNRIVHKVRVYETDNPEEY